MTRRRRRRRTPRPAQGDAASFLSTEAMVEATGLTREALWRARRDGGLEAGIHYVRVGRRLLWHLPNFRRWQQDLDGTGAEGPTPAPGMDP